MGNMSTANGDWFEDEAVSFQDALSHFEQLEEAEQRGPLPLGAVWVKEAPPTLAAPSAPVVVHLVTQLMQVSTPLPLVAV